MEATQMFLEWLMWVIMGIAKLIGWTFHLLLTWRVKHPTSSGHALTKQQQQEHDEDERLAECRSIVNSVKEVLGYIARESISREELEKLCKRSRGKLVENQQVNFFGFAHIFC